MKPALKEPLLPVKEAQHQETPPGWRHTLELLWKYSRPRSFAESWLCALVLLLVVVSKILNILSPMVLRRIVDMLSSPDSGGVAATLPVVLLFCGLKVATDGCVQLQSACWGRVSYGITQRVSLSLFEHLHALSLRWHLNRKTGEVLTVMSQGVSGVSALIQVLTCSISATVLELLLTSAVFAKVGVPAISLCVIGGAVLYTIWTLVITRMRTEQRRKMNAAQKRAQECVVDSLLNFETVKLFACEQAEAARYAGLTSEYKELQRAAQDSLSLLNWGQTVAMQLGMAGGLLVACASTASGEMSVGDFVMIQLFITQLFRPLSNLGGNYRQASRGPL